jgi:hypothetical protein
VLDSRNRAALADPDAPGRARDAHVTAPTEQDHETALTVLRELGGAEIARTNRLVPLYRGD